METKNCFSKSFFLFVLVYAILSLLFFWIVKDDWRSTTVSTDAVNRDTVSPELTEESEIRQEFTIASDRLMSLTLYVNKHPGASEDSNLKVRIVSGERDVFSCEIPYSSIGVDGIINIPVNSNTELAKESDATLILQADGKLSLWFGSSRTAGKFQVNVETSGLQMNGEPVDGELVLSQRGVLDLPYMDYYWPVACVLFLLLAGTILYCHFCQIHNRENLINKGIFLIQQYWYLLKTLVVRDFKIRYKASTLGVLWSFLNPLLMTFVYMFVFSTLFRNSIEHFVVYLMSGIILFNYFSEASNLGMQSIVGNASLIKKVYMPKYIFPISKAISSGINLVISLIPLLIMMALNGVRFHKSLLLVPIVMLFLIVFAIGVGLILASIMVYFRDIQFIWGISITILNFLSPIFYPESIIPARFITLYHMNPIYQFLFFMRTITLGGISPTPITYLYCILASTITLLLGLYIFRKAQSNFVLHL